MGYAYTVRDQGVLHYVTFTVHQWADVFTRSKYVDLLIDSLKYCQKEKEYLLSSAGDFYGVRKGRLELSHFG